MLARITGTLVDLDPAPLALVALPGGIAHEVMLAPYTAHRLGDRIGQEVTLHTLQFLESPNQGATFIPRLAGFLSRDDRAFYELLTSVKGIGPKRGLRAMAMAPAQIAAAIADKDAKLLQALPEIGRKMAEGIILELEGKVQRYLGGAAAAEPAFPAPAKGNGKGAGKAKTPVAAADAGAAQKRQVARETVSAFMALGENPTDAMQWVDRVMAAEPAPASVAEAMQAVYRLRA